jgi:hypothetical protein
LGKEHDSNVHELIEGWVHSDSRIRLAVCSEDLPHPQGLEYAVAALLTDSADKATHRLRRVQEEICMQWCALYIRWEYLRTSDSCDAVYLRGHLGGKHSIGVIGHMSHLCKDKRSHSEQVRFAREQEQTQEKIHCCGVE